MSVSKISVDLATLPTSYPSLCIPRVFSNITWQRVKEVFVDLGLGDIERVDMVRKENDKGEKFQRVFVHFRSWNTSEDAQAVREKVLSGDMIQIVYDDPWFWKVGMSKIAKPERDNRVSDRRDDHRRGGDVRERRGRDYDDRRRGGDRDGYRRRDYDDRRGRDTRRSGGYREQRPRQQHHRQVRGDSRKDYASSEIGQLKEMVAAQAQQMAMMQQMLMGGMGMSAQPHSPPLSPHSPPMTANDDLGPYSPPYPPMSPKVTETVEVTAPVKKRVIRKAPKITPKKLVLSDEDAPAAASPATPTLED